MPSELVIEPLLVFLSLLSGTIVGFSLGLVGGGGSVLAVPLLLYVIGVKDTHAAIGISALSVGVIAAINLISHKRKGHVDLKKGTMFAIPGVLGTLLGSQLGLMTPSSSLLVFFAIFMIIIAALMLRKKAARHDVISEKKGTSLAKNIPVSGFAIGTLAGYFGIGGGFLIVPSLMYSGSLSILDAIGTSLLSVSTFGFVTASRYILEGHVDLLISAFFVVGGVFGGLAGIKSAEKIPSQNLTKIFAVLLLGVAGYILFSSIVL